MKLWVDEAYQLYIQGFSYNYIESHLGVNKSTIRYHIKRYAYQNKLIYPRLKPNYELAFNLYLNTMSIKDIAMYMGVCPNTIRNYIRHYSERNGIELMKSKPNEKSKVAYHLRLQGYTYDSISKMLGYDNRSNCHRAIKKYMESLC